jgi:SAM-dependent methyltransferase
LQVDQPLTEELQAMTNQSSQPEASTRETYTQAQNPAFDAQMAGLPQMDGVAFFLPHLRPGMRVLDVGCGLGGITQGLAAVVAPGEVVGLDLRPEVLEQARAAAAARRLANVRFELGPAYALPFPDSSFDAALAHMVLMHLREPVRALAEMRRVLRPGGVVGVRSVDLGARIGFPASPLWDEVLALNIRVYQHNGGDPFLGRQHRRHLLDAGFARTEAGASVSAAGSLAETRQYAAFTKAFFQGAAQTAAGGRLD